MDEAAPTGSAPGAAGVRIVRQSILPPLAALVRDPLQAFPPAVFRERIVRSGVAGPTPPRVACAMP